MCSKDDQTMNRLAKQTSVILTKQLQWLEKFISEARLPDGFTAIACDYYLPLSKTLSDLCIKKRLTQNNSFIVGINGAQGTGKSTLAEVLAGLLNIMGHSTAILSIDDLYLTKAERSALGETVHPLFCTRGVPGTHDVQLGNKVIQSLCSGQIESGLTIPRFDKSIDDRKEAGSAFPNKPVDIVLFEGWCVGACAEPNDNLQAPMNSLETSEDPYGVWRKYINDQLQTVYPSLFDSIDYLIMLKAPDFKYVYQWRGEQEAKLKASIIESEGEAALKTHSGLMDEQALERFIMHYERLTRWILDEMPTRADYVLHLTPSHTIDHVSYGNKNNIQDDSMDRPKLLVVTDLDATLLDDQYSWEAARDSLLKLTELNCPVVLNSSKTHWEMAHIARDLAKQVGMPYRPIIAENGGVVAIPIEGSNDPDYELEYPGLSRDSILKVVQELRQEKGYRFSGFHDMSVNDVISVTGLTYEDAKLSMKRHATEPILWEDTEERWNQFESDIANHSIRTLRGGRFIHLMGEVDKADGLWHVFELFKARQPEDKWITVALGDSPNDLAMLNSADIAIAIDNPHRPGQLDISAPHVIRPIQTGPAGWHEGMQQVISQILDY